MSLLLLESETRGGISLLYRCSNGQGGIDGAGADRLPSMALRIMLLLPAGGGGGCGVAGECSRRRIPFRPEMKCIPIRLERGVG